MNRVIKFRAWDDENKKMYHFNFEDIYQEGEMTSVHACASWSLFDMPHMQFTGLKDLNNIDVYEFDIIKVTKGSFSCLVGSIEFQDTKFILKNISGRGEIDLFNVYCFGKDSIEIIGNVFQNPELLEKEKTND